MKEKHLKVYGRNKELTTIILPGRHLLRVKYKRFYDRIGGRINRKGNFVPRTMPLKTAKIGSETKFKKTKKAYSSS